jgi:DNA-binding beta-propeller fold protein YncE
MTFLRVGCCLSHTVGPWGLVHSGAFLFVASFGSDQVLIFEASTGRFVDALGNSDTLDSPEGLALSPDGRTLFVASFLDSRIVAFRIGPAESESLARGEFANQYRTLVRGTPVDLEYLNHESDDNYLPTQVAGRRLEMLRGPEGIVALDDERIAVTSFYNKSVLILDSKSGDLLEVIMGPAGSLEGPMGIALEEPCFRGRTCLLVTAYKTREPGIVARFVDFPGAGWRYDGFAMSSNRLVGPAAVAVLDDGSALVCSYDDSSLLVFNATDAAEERSIVLSVTGFIKAKGSLALVQKKTTSYALNLGLALAVEAANQQERHGSRNERKKKTKKSTQNEQRRRLGGGPI